MPSAASLSQRDLERLRSLTFFLDYQIGRYVVADALRDAGATVEVHIDHFAPATPDLEWIPEIGNRRWVLITRDANIRRNPLERAAYEAAGLRGFIVTGKEMGGPDLAALLVRCLQAMENRADSSDSLANLPWFRPGRTPSTRHCCLGSLLLVTRHLSLLCPPFPLHAFTLHCPSPLP